MSKNPRYTAHGDAHSAEPTNDPYPNVPPPAGAVRACDSDDDGAARYFRGGS